MLELKAGIENYNSIYKRAGKKIEIKTIRIKLENIISSI